jgi:hypothetical protein
LHATISHERNSKILLVDLSKIKLPNRKSQSTVWEYHIHGISGMMGSPAFEPEHFWKTSVNNLNLRQTHCYSMGYVTSRGL